MYIASADWMTRNLSRRVEVGFPIFDGALRQEVRHLIDLQLQDNKKARTITNQYIRTKSPAEEVRAQFATYTFLQYLKQEAAAEQE